MNKKLVRCNKVTPKCRKEAKHFGKCEHSIYHEEILCDNGKLCTEGNFCDTPYGETDKIRKPIKMKCLSRKTKEKNK